MSTGQMTAVQQRRLDAIRSFNEEVKTKARGFEMALPDHIPVARFMRVVLTAVQLTPELLDADRQSLWNSSMKAANDGLLPDGKEGALVAYSGKVNWLPMIAGIRKKVRNSKELSDWNAHVVYAKDAFEYQLGDDPFIRHVPFNGSGDRGPIVAAYSVAKYRGTGDLSRLVMTRAELDKVRAASKTTRSDSPWNTWEDQMYIKTVAKRHSKVLPMSTDLDDLMRRDDELYNFKGGSDAAPENKKLSGRERLDALLGGGDVLPPADVETVDQETGEVTTGQKPAEAEAAKSTRKEQAEAKKADEAAAQATAKPQGAAADKPDPTKAALLDRLTKSAGNGTPKLRLALRSISQADEKLLTEADHNRLGDLAADADAQAKEA